MEHAHWIIEKKRDSGSRHTCSKCGFWYEFNTYHMLPLDIKYNYCKHCGAKMDEEGDNEKQSTAKPKEKQI